MNPSTSAGGTLNPQRTRPRTSIGRLIAWIIERQLKSRYLSIEIQGSRNLVSAVRLYPRVTIFSSHTTNYDIAALDSHVRETFGNDRFPVFISRDNLPIHIMGGWYLPVTLSRYLLNSHCKTIALSQKDSRDIFRILPQIESAYAGGHVVIVFPGATRHRGAVNGLTPASVATYTALMKRRRLLPNHCYLPVGFRYDNAQRSMSISFGSPFPLYDGIDSREAGRRIFEEIADLAGVSTENVYTAAEVQTFLASRYT